MACCIWRTVVGDSSSASWLDVPNKTSWRFTRRTADVGLKSFSATGFAFGAAFADAFFARGFALVVVPSESSLDLDRLRGGFFAGASVLFVETSFRGTFEVVVRGEKKSLVTGC